MRIIFFFLFIQVFFSVASVSVKAQQLKHAWENYIVSLDGRPVSINVDLGLQESAPLKELPYVIIVRTSINIPNSDGMPDADESVRLFQLEDLLVEGLARQNGALYTGRFTQRGIREFYFYAPDTVRYHAALEKAFEKFTSYKWLAKAKLDQQWDNYFNVLCPSEQDKIKIDSRRRIEEIKAEIGNQYPPLYILHYFEFPTPEARKKFLMDPKITGFSIDFLPVERKEENAQYELVVGRLERPDFAWIEKTVISLYKVARSFKGKYKGWDYTNK